MKYYPSDEYRYCLEVVRRHSRDAQPDDKLHRLLMEQRELAAEKAYQAGVQAERRRLLDDDWNQATLGQMRERIADEKFYAPLIQAAACVDGLPERSLRLLKEWVQGRQAIDQEFEEFMGELPP